MEKEAVNFVLDKVSDPFITRYVNHVSSSPNSRNAQHAIFPDLHAHNFPTDRQRVNDSKTTSSAEAIFKVKTYTACITRYNHNNTTTKPPDQRAREVTNEYSRKFRKLDTVFAEEVVGNGENGTTGPIEIAQGRLFCGKVIPTTAG